MVVRHNDRQSRILGNPDPCPIGNACVASQQHVRLETRILQQRAQLQSVDSVPFAEAVRHMKADALRPRQLLQRRHQHRRARLAVHVEVPPHQEVLTLVDSIEQRPRGLLQPNHPRVGRAGLRPHCPERQTFPGVSNAPLRKAFRTSGCPPTAARSAAKGSTMAQDPRLCGHWGLCEKLCLVC